jgi:hypothetical protein
VADKKHELVSRLKEIASHLGRAPKREELQDYGVSRHDIEREFGLFTYALQAAGIDKVSSKEKTKQKVESYFTRDIKDLIKVKPALPFDMPKFKRTVIIGDLHLPWVSTEHLMMAYQFIETVKPEVIVQAGDSFDFFSFSKFPRSRINISVQDEVQLGRKMAEEFWKSIQRVAPRARCVQLIGNHDIRPMKRVIESNCPELEVFFNLNKFFEFPGVETFQNPREPFVQDGISFIHGFTSAGKHRAKLQTNVVHGHLHRGQLLYTKMPDGRFLWELDCGYLGDPSQPCFTYTPVKELNWTRGVGFISEYGPHWIPLE